MIGVKQIGGGGSSESQDNIDIVKYFSTGTASTSRLVDTVSGILDFMPQLEIGETQSLWLNFLFSDSVTVRYKMINKGKGIYGVGALPIDFTDLHFVSSSGTTAVDLEEIPTTTKYYIDDLGGQTIRNFVNARFLGYEIKDKALGETIFKVGIEPDYVTYWFVGDSGTYGEGLLQSVDSDFELLSIDVDALTTEQVQQMIDETSILKQDKLISGANIKTINGQSILGNGNISISAFPSPNLNFIVPDNQLPNTTFNIFFHGDYFTPAMTVAIAGQTVNSVIYQNSNLVLVNITTGNAEGLFAITLNNGTASYFPSALLVVLGTVYTPKNENIIPLTGGVEVDNDSIIKTTAYGIKSTFFLDYLIPAGQDFRVTGKAFKSPYYINESNNERLDFIELFSQDDLIKYTFMISCYNGGNNNINLYQQSTGGERQFYRDNILGVDFFIQRIGTEISFWINNVKSLVFTDASTVDLKIKMGVYYGDWNVKYIELY